MIELTRLRRRALSDRGEADPYLVIAAIAVSTVIAATLVGVLTLVIQSGANIVTENLRSTNAALAQKVWAQDANNASVVVQKDATEVSFYEVPGRLPGVYVQRDATPLTYCRKSTWTFSDEQIVNRVAQFDNDVCDLDDPLVQPNRSTTLLTLDGLVDGAGVVSENAAGRDLHFVNFDEVGLDADSDHPSVNDRATWWRDYEWEFDQPRRVNLDARLALPLSGEVDGTLRGTTNIASTRSGDVLDDVEDNPVVTPFDPGTLSGLTVSRSTTVGAVVAGVREGIRISFNGVSCGPFSAQYTVTWTPSTPGAEPRQSVFTATGTPAPVNFSGVPNGARGVVNVEASCPASVSSERPTVDVVYTQPLPVPTLTGQVGTQPHLHSLSWTRVSSLPVQYRTEVSRGGGAWANQSLTQNPTTLLAASLAWPTGSTYGVNHDYRVTAQLDGRTAGPSAPVSLFTGWPALTPPTIDDSGSGNSRTITSTAVACPAGTAGQYRFRVQLNDGAWGAWTAWSTSRTHTITVAQGQQYRFESEARCSYSPEQSSPPTNPPGGGGYIHPIVTAPNPPTTTINNPSNPSTNPDVTRNVTGCPANTTAEYRMRTRINGGAWSAWSAWTATQTVPASVRVGEQLIVEVIARCTTPHSTGPESSPGTRTWVRPIPAPAAPTNIRNDGGGTSSAKNDRVLWNAVSCPAGTTAQYRRQNTASGSYGSYGTALHNNIGTAWGTSYSFRAQARCISSYTQSPGSPLSAATSWTTNVPTPSTPTVSISPGSAITGQWFTVSGSGASCPSGTSIRWNAYTSGSGTTWSSQSFNDYWNTAGTRTYYMRAQCFTSQRTGAWSAYGARSIAISNPPPPATPGGVWATWNTGVAGGGVVQGGWSAVSGASSYSYGANHFVGGFWRGWIDRTSTSAGTFSIANCGNPATMTAGQFRVRAIGSGGSSGTTTISASRNTSGLTCG